jgi:hypothetical protein
MAGYKLVPLDGPAPESTKASGQYKMSALPTQNEDGQTFIGNDKALIDIIKNPQSTRRQRQSALRNMSDAGITTLDVKEVTKGLPPNEAEILAFDITNEGKRLIGQGVTARPQPERAPGKIESYVIGTGRGLTDVGEGVQQLYYDLMVSMGPGGKMMYGPKADEFAKEVAAERQFYAGTPVAQSFPGKLGRLTGNIAPFMLVPTPVGAFSTLPRSLGTGLTFGLGYGAVEQPEGATLEERMDNRGTNMLVSGATGMLSGAGGYGLNRLLTRKAPADIARRDRIVDVVPDEGGPIPQGRQAPDPNRMKIPPSLKTKAKQITDKGRSAKFLTGKDVEAMLISKAKRAGIDLTPAEITNMKSLIRQQKALTNLDEAGAIMDDFLAKRKIDIESAVERTLGGISQVDDPTVAGMMTRGASQNAIDRANKVRQSKAAPLYDEAFDTAGPINIESTLDLVNKKLSTTKGKLNSGIKKVRSLLFKTGPDGKLTKLPEDDLRALQGVKWEIEDMIAKHAGRKNYVRILTEIKNDLTGSLGAQSPKFAEANAVFSQESGGIDEIGKSLVNVLAKYDDMKLHKAAMQAFSPTTSSPRSVAIAKRIISKESPDAWNAMTRAYLQDLWEKTNPVNYATAREALHGPKFAAKIKNIKQNKILKAALDKKQYQALSDLGDVLEATGRAVDVGSDTAWKLGNAGFLRRVAGSPARAAKNALDFYQRVKIGKEGNKLVNIITSPNGIKKLKELKRLSPRTQKWLAEFVTLFGIGATDERNNSDDQGQQPLE